MSKIKHQGIVESVGEHGVKVRIVQTSACASCKVAGHCRASESREKLVDVCDDGGLAVSKGDEVTVVANSGVGMSAVTIAFTIPFVVLVSVLFVVSRFTDDEPLVAFAGIGSLIPYYMMLYLLRDKISRRMTFSFEK